MLQTFDPLLVVTLVSVSLGITLTILRIYYYTKRTKELGKKQKTVEEPKTETPQYQIYECPLCKGDGIYQNKKCSSCKGIGKIKAPPDSVICGTCKGTGLYQNTKKCKICKGRGRIPAYYIKRDD